MQSTQAAFGHRHNEDTEVFVADLGNGKILQFRPATGAYALKDGRKKPVMGVWRLNEVPTGKAPSAWIDVPGGDNFALWFHADRDFYSIKLSEPKRATGTLLI